MSNWTMKYEAHEFHKSWEIFKEKIGAFREEELSSEETGFYRRILKLSEYITAFIAQIDPELISFEKLDECQNNLASILRNYIDAKQYFSQINDYTYKIFDILKQYAILNVDVPSMEITNRAFNKYAKTTSEALNTFNNEMNKVLAEINEQKVNVDNVYQNIFSSQEKIKELENQYFVGDIENDVQSLEVKMDSFESRVRDYTSDINDYHTKLLVDKPEQSSISQSIALLKQRIEDDAQRMQDISNENDNRIEELRIFYDEIYGVEKEDGTKEGGLRQELRARQEELTAFELVHTNKYRSFINQIEGLLPGAISAGLASAYLELKKSFEEPKKIYTALFIGAIGLILSIGIFLEGKHPSIPSATEPVTSESKKSNYTGEFKYGSSGVGVSRSVSPSEIVSKEMPTNHWMSMLNRLLYKLPFILPLIWLAAFAAKRRSEVMRLEQEYAHKEALAKSYQSFKQQIDDLGNDNQELLVKLLDSAITAVSFNASSTLDKSHGEKTPVTEVIDKTIDKVISIKDFGNK